MLSTFAYLGCLLGISPAVGLALFFTVVDKVASANGMPGFGRLLLRLLEFIGTPWKTVTLVVCVIALFAAGCVRASRGWACLVVGVLGLVCIAQIVVLARPREPGQFVILVPSVIATAAALAWSWQILRTDLFG